MVAVVVVVVVRDLTVLVCTVSCGANDSLQRNLIRTVSKKHTQSIVIIQSHPANALD